MTNLEGRVIRRRRALPPPDGVLDDLQVMKALADRLGRGRLLQRRPARGLRRAAAGQRRRDRRLRRHHLRADRRRAGRLLALPDRGPSRHAAAVRRLASRPPTAGRPSSGSSTATPAETPGRRLPVRADHRPADGAVPERHPDPAGAEPWPSPSVQPEAQLHPDLARRLEHRRRRHRRAAPRAAAPRRSGPGSATTSGRTRSSCPFHWGGASAANALTNPVLDRHSTDARLQGVRGRAWSADRRRPTTTTCSTRPPVHTVHAAHTRPTLNQLLQPVPTEGPPHAHQEPVPPRRLPLRGRRPGQAGADQRRAQPRRARTA